MANRDIMVEAKGQNVQRYVYGTDGARISAEFTYAKNTDRGNGGENILSDMAVLDNKKIYYRRSLLDSTLFAVDESGDVFQHSLCISSCNQRFAFGYSLMIYDAWGNPGLETKLDANYMGVQNLNNFTGYTWDETLGLYFAQNRFYDSVSHRFMQEDPVKDGTNWFAYCENNPLTNTDVWGLATRYVGNNDVNMRERASISARILYCLKKGARVDYLGIKESRDGYNWAKVTYGGKTGWIVAKFLRVASGIDSNHSSTIGGDKDLAEFGKNSVIYAALLELRNIQDSIIELQSAPDFNQSSYYSANLNDIDKLANKLREIGRKQTITMNQFQSKVNEWGGISKAEYVIYMYYPQLACATFFARDAARMYATDIYNSAKQYGSQKKGGYLDGGNSNAFVHAAWNAFIYEDLVYSSKYDKNTAKELTWLATAMHEYTDVGATKNIAWLSNVNMDMYNNKKGVAIADNVFKNDYSFYFGSIKIDNQGDRMADLTLALVRGVDNGYMMRNSKIDASGVSQAINWPSYTLSTTNKSERHSAYNQDKSVKDLVYYLGFQSRY